MGVRALTAGSIKCILNQHPKAKVSLLDYSRNSSIYNLKLDDSVVPVPLVNMRFSKKIYLPNNIAFLLLLATCLKLIPSRRMRGWLMTKNRCLRHIMGADLIASIAGGDSFSDIYGLERLLYVALPQILVLLIGKRLILLPQTIGPFRRGSSRLVARYILRRAERVYSRDYRGLKEGEELLARGKAFAPFKFCYDVGFVVDAVPPARLEVVGLPLTREVRGNLVGLNISGLLFMGGYRQNNMFGLQVDYKELVHGLIDFLITKKGAKVLLVPHVFGDGATSESDQPACEQVYEALRNKYSDGLGLVRGSYDQSEIKYVIGRCDFFVGSRMHACIAAVSQHVPCVCIAYSSKFIGVMETTGIESMVADARRLSFETILEVIGQSYDCKAIIHQQLERKMPELTAFVLNLFRDVQDIPGKRGSLAAAAVSSVASGVSQSGAT